MSRILEAPSLTVICEAGSTTLLRLNAPLKWVDATRWIEIPAGFLFDGASVPNILYPLLDATPLDLIIPGALHDYAYRLDALQIGLDPKVIKGFTRDEADELLCDAAAFCGVSGSDQRKLYYGARVGGESSYAQKPVRERCRTCDARWFEEHAEDCFTLH